MQKRQRTMETAMPDELPGQKPRAEIRVESELLETRSPFHQLPEKLPAAAYVCDTAGLITYYNRYAVQLWGRAPKLNDPIDRFCGSYKLFLRDDSPLAHDQCWMARALAMDQKF